MGVKKNGSLGIFLMLLHVVVSRGLAGRHGVDVNPSPNLDEQTVLKFRLFYLVVLASIEFKKN